MPCDKLESMRGWLCPLTKEVSYCCKTGWVVVLVVSRFCMAAELWYVPIEGEMLGLKWALHKTFFLVQTTQ